MSSRLNGSGLFTTAISGLNSNYATILAQSASENGISLKDILNVSKSVTNSVTGTNTSVNSSFSSFLSANFNSLDKDGDGVMSAEEITNYTNQLYQQGMTQEQLYALCAQYGSNSTLQEVLDNFAEIDKNHDGKVTQTEIASYGIEEEIDEKKEEYDKFLPSRMSVFYSTGSDDV